MSLVPEVYGSIWIDFGSITSQGLGVGSATRELRFSPDGLMRLMRRLGDAGAVEALAAAIKHGELHLDPPRIIVPGFSRDWICEHTELGPSASRRALSRLTASGPGAGLIAQQYSGGGVTQKRVGVVNGAAFSWVDADAYVPLPPPLHVVPDAGSEAGPVYEGATATPKPVVGPLQLVHEGTHARQAGFRPDVHNDATELSGQVAFVQVRDREAGFRPDVHTHAADASGQIPTARSTGELPSGRPAGSRPDDREAKPQVSAPGRKATTRTGTAPTSKEGSRKEVFLDIDQDDDEGGPLTRPSLRVRLAHPDLIEALQGHEDGFVTALAPQFAKSPARTVKALDFFDRPHGDPARGDQVDLDLARFVFDLLTVPEESTGPVARDLVAHLDRRGSKVPRLEPRDLLVQLALALVTSSDSDVKQWKAWLVWAVKEPALTSAAVTTFEQLLDAVLSGVPAPAPQLAASNATPSGVGSSSRPESVKARPARPRGAAAPDGTSAKSAPPLRSQATPLVAQAERQSALDALLSSSGSAVGARPELAPPSPAPTDPEPGPVVGKTGGLPVREPDRAPPDAVDEAMAEHGAGYWDWLVSIADGELNHEAGMNLARRNRRIQEHYIVAHRRRTTSDSD